MIWFTLRQHRTELLILGGLVAVLCMALLITGYQNYQLYTHLGIAACLRESPTFSSSCSQTVTQFTTTSYGGLRPFFFWLNVIPALYGILIGVPLLGREYEQGTYRFAWTQGITLQRWVMTKLGVLLSISLILVIPLTIILTWWNAPFIQFTGAYGNSFAGFDVPYSLAYYDFTGVIPAAYMIFAFALGVVAGSLFRRVIPAVAVTFLYIPLWQIMDNIWRGGLIPPIVQHYQLTAASPALQATSWVIDGGTIDRIGHKITNIPGVCKAFQSLPPSPSQAAQLNQCMADHGYRGFIAYHPLSHFWLMQSVEAGILVITALLFMGLALWQAARRMT